MKTHALPIVLAAAAALSLAAQEPVPPTLPRLQSRLEVVIDSLDRDVAKAAAALAEKGLLGPETRGILRVLCAKHAGCVDCTAVDAKGVMRVVEPEAYRKFEGQDISGQEQVQRLHQNRKPVLSAAFKAVEGFDAVDLEHPVLGPSGELLGSVSALVKPEALLAEACGGAAEQAGFEVWVLQSDGRILYGTRKQSIGKNLFADERFKAFPSVAALGRQLAERYEGAAAYEFAEKGQKPVPRRAFWTTYDLHGTAWRILITRNADVTAPFGPAIVGAVGTL
jgi:hypothetical protein